MERYVQRVSTRSRAVAVGTAGIALALVLAGCGGSGGNGGAGQSDDEATFVVGQTAPIEVLNPHGFNQSKMAWHRAVYDALTVMDPDPQPHLAESWEVNEDFSEYTFSIAQGVTFHDGSPLTADIVVENLEWASNPDNLVTGGALLATAEITAPDENTVVVSFPGPAPQLLATLAIIPIMDLSADLNTSPNGTGPYALKSFVANSVVTMERNEEYWNDDRQPQVQTYEVRVFSDNASAVASLSSGQIDAFAFPPFNQLGQLEDQGNRIVTQDAPGNFIIRLNTAVEPLDDVRVRQALSHAVDRQTFADLTDTDLIVPTCNIYPEASPAHLPEVDAACEQDLERAEDLLAEAGFADGLELEMDINAARWPELTAYAPVLQEQLATIGVDLKLNDITPTLAQQRILEGTYQTAVDWYPWGNLDPALLFVTRTFTPGLTLENYDEPEYAEMVQAAQVEADVDKRTQMYRELNQYMIDASFVIPVASRPYVYVTGEDVAEFEFDPFGMVDPTSATFEG
jgi:peptide/nickel transport system substrate-binding protein